MFFHENDILNVVCTLMANLSQPQCIMFHMSYKYFSGRFTDMGFNDGCHLMLLCYQYNELKLDLVEHCCCISVFQYKDAVLRI